MKNNNSKNKIIDVIISLFENISLTNYVNVENNEYYKNIGTIYKGSIEESNKKLRFKERFRKRINDGVCWCDNCICKEGI